MSEKITFRELIESIAEETNNSKQYTHDFLKDFVDVINDGLEQDGKVNIAGFGKFKLRRMDEREGYNPQTGEQITIPEHNKIVFKPYKDLRELVNAPYAHLEPELIEENTPADGKHEEEHKSESGDEQTAEQDSQDDFIPTAPPTAHKADEETESSEDRPFVFDDEDEKDPSKSAKQENEIEDRDKDIVEFRVDQGKDDSMDLGNFISPIEPSDSKDTTSSGKQNQDEIADSEENNFAEDRDESDLFGLDASEEQTAFETEEAEKYPDKNAGQESREEPVTDEEDFDPFAEGFEETEDKDEKPSIPVPSSPSNTRSGKKIPALITAAAVVLLVIAAGAWYFTASNSSIDFPEMIIGESASSTVVQKNNQEKSANQAASKTEDQNQTQETSTANNASRQNSTEWEIERGQTLWSIAEDKYGNPRLWPWIYGENGSLENPDLILAGNSLSVPLPSGPQNSLNYADSVGVAKGHIASYEWYKNNNPVKAKNHLWAAKSYHHNVRDITDIPIDQADLTYVNQSR